MYGASCCQMYNNLVQLTRILSQTILSEAEVFGRELLKHEKRRAIAEAVVLRIDSSFCARQVFVLLLCSVQRLLYLCQVWCRTLSDPRPFLRIWSECKHLVSILGSNIAIETPSKAFRVGSANGAAILLSGQAS